MLCLQLRHEAWDAISNYVLRHALSSLCAAPCCVNQTCAGQVYRGKWCSVDIAAKEYLAVEDGETELHTSGQDVTEQARQRAQVRAAASCLLWLVPPI